MFQPWEVLSLVLVLKLVSREHHTGPNLLKHLLEHVKELVFVQLRIHQESLVVCTHHVCDPLGNVWFYSSEVHLLFLTVIVLHKISLALPLVDQHIRTLAIALSTR